MTSAFGGVRVDGAVVWWRWSPAGEVHGDAPVGQSDKACRKVTAVSAGLAFTTRCADWERREDPDGQGLPRAKVSDDKTLAAVVL